MARTSTWEGLVLILATCLVFARVCAFDFTIWDDNIVVWNNPYLNPPTLAHTLIFWTRPYYTLYLPITYTIWAIVAAAGWTNVTDSWGNHLNPYLFHGLNLGLHVACVVTIWRLIRRLTKSNAGAMVEALIFALHPVQVEAVAWVTAARDLLGTLFSVLAVLVFLDFREAESNRSRFFTASSATLLFVAAIFSKPTAVVTPLLVAIICLWEFRKWRADEIVLIGIWLIGAAADVQFTHLHQPVDPLILQGQPGLWFRPFVACDALAFDFWKLLYPVNLGIDYGRTPSALLQSGQWRWTWIVPVGIATVLLKLGRKPALCGAIFLVGVLPLLGLTSYRFEVYYGTVADRYLYPAMLGLALGVAMAWSKIGARHRSVALSVTIIVVGTCAAVSYHQLAFWSDSMALFTHAIDVNPRTFAGHQNRGAVENHDGRFEEAETDFRSLIEISPQAPEGYRGLARAQLGLMRVDGAMDNWSKALALQERNINIHGEMAADYRQELANHYSEAAAMARSVNQTARARVWDSRAREYSHND